MIIISQRGISLSSWINATERITPLSSIWTDIRFCRKYVRLLLAITYEKIQNNIFKNIMSS